MVKADDKFELKHKTKGNLVAPFSNFEILERKVNFLMVMVNDQAQILKENGIYKRVDPFILSDQDVLQSFREEDGSGDDGEDDEEESGKGAGKSSRKNEKTGEPSSHSVEDELEGILDDEADEADEADEDDEDDEDEPEEIKSRLKKRGLPKLPKPR